MRTDASHSRGRGRERALPPRASRDGSPLRWFRRAGARGFCGETSEEHTSGDMKFGKYLGEQKRPEWRHYYLDYSTLKVGALEFQSVG